MHVASFFLQSYQIPLDHNHGMHHALSLSLFLFYTHLRHMQPTRWCVFYTFSELFDPTQHIQNSIAARVVRLSAAAAAMHDIQVPRIAFVAIVIKNIHNWGASIEKYILLACPTGNNNDSCWSSMKRHAEANWNKKKRYEENCILLSFFYSKFIAIAWRNKWRGAGDELFAVGLDNHCHRPDPQSSFSPTEKTMGTWSPQSYISCCQIGR